MLKMYMGLPTTGNTSAAQGYVLRDLEKRYAGKIEFVYPEKASFRMFHDFARNCIVEEFLASKCDVLWFLDSDIVPHHDVLEYIDKHWNEWDMAGAPYPVFMTPTGESTPQVVFTVYKNISEKAGMAACSIPAMGKDYVDGVATGCIFVKRKVFEKLDKPYFKFTYRENDRYLERGEDLDFCMRTSKLGFKFFINYEYVCRHYKNIDLLDVNNYAIDFANKSLKNYDVKIREQLTQMYMDKKFGRNGVSSSTPISDAVEKTANYSGNKSPNLGQSLP